MSRMGGTCRGRGGTATRTPLRGGQRAKSQKHENIPKSPCQSVFVRVCPCSGAPHQRGKKKPFFCKNRLFVDFYGKLEFEPSSHENLCCSRLKDSQPGSILRKPLRRLIIWLAPPSAPREWAHPKLVGAERRTGGGFGEETIKFYEEPKNRPFLPKTVCFSCILAFFLAFSPVLRCFALFCPADAANSHTDGADAALTSGKR